MADVVTALVKVYSEGEDKTKATYWSKVVATSFSDMYFLLNSKKAAHLHASEHLLAATRNFLAVLPT